MILGPGNFSQEAPRTIHRPISGYHPCGSTETPKPIKPIRRNNFQYDGNSFTTLTGFAFESPEKLRNLCRRRATGRSPRNSLEQDSSGRVTSKVKASGMSREFIVAQHRFYGFPVLWQRRDNYIKMFRALVKDGRVPALPISQQVWM